MPRLKNIVVTIRTTDEIKSLLQLAAERERRSATSMVEMLVLDYASKHSISLPDSRQSETK